MIVLQIQILVKENSSENHHREWERYQKDINDIIVTPDLLRNFLLVNELGIKNINNIREN